MNGGGIGAQGDFHHFSEGNRREAEEDHPSVKIQSEKYHGSLQRLFLKGNGYITSNGRFAVDREFEYV